MKLWQTDKYIKIFGYKFYYKQFFLLKIAKPLHLKCYRDWKLKKNRKKHLYKTNNAKAKRNRIKHKTCFVCKQPFQLGDNITLEHIIPRSKLKDKKLYDNPKNHALSHYHCNQKKADL